jgi:hypothetical protein
VRPTDEDQSGSRRPNLMSSTRRTANETNILAMLDRHESGGRMRRMLRGCAAGRPCSGTGAPAWSSSAWWVRWPGWRATAGRPRPSTRAGRGGRGQGPAGDGACGACAVRRLRLRLASVTASAEASAEVRMRRRRPAPPSSTSRRRPSPAERAGAAAPGAARACRRNSMPAASQRARASASFRPRSARPRRPHCARTARAAPQARRPLRPPSGQAHAEPRSRRPRIAPAKPAPAAVDTDVALISAIIQHANKRQEAEEAAASHNKTPSCRKKGPLLLGKAMLRRYTV